MKKLVYISVIVLSFISLSLIGKSKSDSVLCLEVTGKVTLAGKNTESPCKVELLLDDQVVESRSLSHGKGKFTFSLNKNSHYTIRLSSPGHVTRTVCVKTELPEKYDTGIYRFLFDTRLPESRNPETITQENMHNRSEERRVGKECR